MRLSFLPLVAYVPCLVMPLMSCGGVISQSATESTKSNLSIMAWNVQNLFDDHKDGGEYPEFVPGSAEGWNTQSYQLRLSRAATVISTSAPLPDMVILEEVENSRVLEDLSRQTVLEGKYSVRLFQEDDGAIHIGLLSRFAPNQILSHRIWLNGESARSLWELHFSFPNAAPLVVFANHWKSKSGGEAETEALRILAARTLTDRATFLHQQQPLLDILACGDLNEIIHENLQAPMLQKKAKRLVGPTMSVRTKSIILALGFDPGGSQTTDVVAIPVKSLPIDQGYGGWFSPWNSRGNNSSGAKGSYYYQGEWEAIDHFLLKGSLGDHKGWEFLDFAVLTSPDACDSDGIPVRWDTRRRTGTSDHLPILLVLSRAPGAGDSP